MNIRNLLLLLPIPLTACTQAVDRTPEATRGATEAPLVVHDATPTIVNGELLPPALALEYSDKLRIAFYVTDMGTFNISQSGTVGSDPRLTEAVAKLNDPVKIVQALAPDVEIPTALRTGYSVPHENHGLSHNAESWLLSHGYKPSDITEMDQRAATAVYGPAPTEKLTVTGPLASERLRSTISQVTAEGSEPRLTESVAKSSDPVNIAQTLAPAPTEKVLDFPFDNCFYTNYFRNVVGTSFPSLTNFALCQPASPTGNNFALCLNYNNYVVAAMNDQGDTKTYTSDVHQVCLFTTNTWITVGPLAPSYWQKNWVLGLPGCFDQIKTYAIVLMGPPGDNVGYVHYGNHCY